MPSYEGAVNTPMDAVILIEASRLGLVPLVHERLKYTERLKIKPGDVFIWNETTTHMKRWTDGRAWSASRVTGSFLTYREMANSANSYKSNGLIKQSFSIETEDHEKYHIISYTTNKHFSKSKLYNKTPSTDKMFKDIVIPKGVYPFTSAVSSPISSPAPAPAPTASSNYTTAPKSVFQPLREPLPELSRLIAFPSVFPALTPTDIYDGLTINILNRKFAI